MIICRFCDIPINLNICDICQAQHGKSSYKYEDVCEDCYNQIKTKNLGDDFIEKETDTLIKKTHDGIVCLECSKTFSVNLLDLTNFSIISNTKYCSVECRTLAMRKRNYQRICVACKKRFIGKYRKQMTCSKECYRKIRSGHGYLKEIPCPICNKIFKPVSSKVKTCSGRCGQALVHNVLKTT